MIAALGGVSGLLTAEPLHAQAAPAVELEWTAPPGCPSESEVRQRVQKLAGAAKSTANPLRADGTITQKVDGRFHLRLVVRSGELVGERNIESGSCEDLAGAAAVALALLLRSEEPLQDFAESPSTVPGSGSGPSRNGGTPAVDGKSGGEKSVGEKSEGRPSERPSETDDTEGRGTSFAPSPGSVHGVLQAPLVALSLGPLPEPVIGFGLAGGVSFERFRFLIEGQKWLEQRVSAEDFPEFGADVERATATLRGCRSFRWDRVALAPCLTLSLEHLSATGSGPEVSPSTQRALWLAPGAGAQGFLLLTSWFNLVVSLDGRIETSRPRISIEGVGEVDQLAPVAVTVVLGSEWIL
jgi:hypothetical protein